jgi:hypothetical protein
MTSRPIPSSPRLPRWLKIAYTVFIAVFIPVYWHDYGPTNFLYFCDIAALTTLVALWTESALLASIAAVGILLPQALWVLDFAVQFLGLKITGMSAYMFDSKLPLFTRLISLFHGWLPFLLAFAIWRLGYDRRALRLWVVLAWALMFISYLWMPRPGATLANPKQPVNIDYVYGFSDHAPQTWMPEGMWFVTVLVAFPLLLWWPTHLLLKRLCPSPGMGGAFIRTRPS